MQTEAPTKEKDEVYECMYYRVGDIASLLKVTRATIYKLIKAGTFPPGFKVGRNRRWRVEQVIDFLKASEDGGK